MATIPHQKQFNSDSPYQWEGKILKHTQIANVYK